MLRFENSFWDNPGQGQQPRYERGPQCLYEKLEQGSSECDELLSFFRERVAIEEAYASSMRKLAERQLVPAGFGRDEGATLKTAYHGLLAECLALSEAHADLSIELQSSVVVPLRAFTSEHRARVRASWKIIDDTVRKASAELAMVDRNHRVYTQKASAAEQLRLKESPSSLQPGASPAEFEVKLRPSTSLREAGTPRSPRDNSTESDAESDADADVAVQRQLLSSSGVGSVRTALPLVQGELDVASIVLGNVALTRHEFHVMLQRMQTEVLQHDVKFGILGTFRGLISGENLAGWWCTNYPTVVRNEADAVAVGQSMMTQGYLRFMGRGSQFQSRSNAYYQWKKPALEFQSDDEPDSEDEPLGNRRAHLGKAVSYERAQREADEASQIYRDSVTRAEHVRTDLDEHLTNYLDSMEVWELNRLMNIKSTLGDYARISKRPIQAELSIGDRLEVYEESLKPQQDIQWMIEHYGTGRYTPRPIVFRPFGLSTAEYQIFGVPLDEQLLVSHKDIPLFPAKVLSLIRKSTRDMSYEDKYKVWTTRALLRNIHDLRNTLNRGPSVTLKHLRSFDLPIVANLLVLYLLELPKPLCPVELQDPLRALYSSRSEKSSNIETLASIRSLLEGLPYVNLKTIQVIFGVLSEQIQGNEDLAARDQFIKAVSQRLGPIILRGREIVGVGVGRLPESFVADLIENYDVVLANIETQRPIKPCARPIKTEMVEATAPEEFVPGRPDEKDRASASSSRPVASKSSLDMEAAAAAAAVAAAKRLSATSSHSAADQSVGKRASVASAGGRSAMTMPNTASTQKSHASLDEDELLVDDILEEARDNGTAGAEDNMDFFLKDEDSDGTGDDDDDEE
ncbi:Rho-GTPase-activating protein 8 [Coemansia spiralis]|uniref:Rho-GTPase-activating protein 8 n=1 Tax=Coemansia spiralis TaxID=417178 RepID=A0A9W8GD77_9FUNG|nr:Rho-GTPase-activating protein 8 [Coemansia spiralis]